MSEWLILSLIYVVFGWFKNKSKHKNKIKSNSFIDNLLKNFTSAFKDRTDYINNLENPNNIDSELLNNSELNDENIVKVTSPKTDESEVINDDLVFKKINLHKRKKIKRDLKNLIRDKTELRNFIILKEVLDKPRALKKNIR